MIVHMPAPSRRRAEASTHARRPVRRRTGLAALLAGVSLAACGATSGSQPAEIARIAHVTDGDTVRLANDARVRLLQIDAPEVRSRECFADAATAALRRLLPPGTSVRLERDPSLDASDRYGRELRYVFAGGRNLNLALVEAGAAAPYFYRGERGRYASRLLAAARPARAARRGLWGACPATQLTPDRAVDARR